MVMMAIVWVIVGGGAAGRAAARVLAAYCHPEEVLLLDREATVCPRLHIPQYLEEGKYPRPAPDGGVRRVRAEVVSLEPSARRLVLSDGRKVSYGRLLLATGAVPALPPLPGARLRGVISLWEWEEARRLAVFLRRGAVRAVVVGAGPLGVRAALMLTRMGCQVAVVEALPQVLPGLVSEDMAAVVRDRLRAVGVEVHCAEEVQGFEGDGRLRAVRTSRRRMPCQLAVLATGTRPDAMLAAEAGLEVRQGVVVNEHLRSSDPNVWAAGDVAEVPDAVLGRPRCYALWSAAAEQGRIAALNMAGIPRRYPPAVPFNSLDVAGLRVVSVGYPCLVGIDRVHLRSRSGGVALLSFREQTLVGAALLGTVDGGGTLYHLIRYRRLVPLPRAGQDLQRWLAGVWVPWLRRAGLREPGWTAVS